LKTIPLICLLLLSFPELFSQRIAAGNAHVLFLCADSTVRSWGLNTSGQLGNGTTVNTNTVIKINALSAITAVGAGGADHSIVLCADSTVWTWGINNNAQLGDSTLINRNIPGQVHGPGNVGFLNQVAALAKGHAHHHNLVILNDSSVWGWGFNNKGQLGDSTLIDRRTPVQTKIPTRITRVALGDVHSLAIDKDSSLWTWGHNSSGQLGDSTIINQVIPVKLTRISQVVDISGGEIFSIALKNDSTVWTWGYNFYGQLGDGTNTNSLVPIQVAGLSGIVSVAAGQEHSLALKNDGTVWGWGLNYYGQLGDSTGTDRWNPVQVKHLTDVVEITGGGYNSYAVKNDGSVWAWGMGSFGQLGNGTQGDPSCYCNRMPVQVWGPCNTATPMDHDHAEVDISIYPNPARDKIFVSGGDSALQSAQAALYTVLGIPVKACRMDQLAAGFDVNDIPSGIYYVLIYAEKGPLFKKIVILK
jgi:alpha-tubulin suppressor-like RCC1 family protein